MPRFDFEGIAASGSFGDLGTLGGLRWRNFSIADARQDNGTGLLVTALTAETSGTAAAMGGGANTAISARHGSFTLERAVFATDIDPAEPDHPFILRIFGLRDGERVAVDRVKRPDAFAPTEIVFDETFAGIDRVIFRGSRKHQTSEDHAVPIFAMDDLQITWSSEAILA